MYRLITYVWIGQSYTESCINVVFHKITLCHRTIYFHQWCKIENYFNIWISNRIYYLYRYIYIFDGDFIFCFVYWKYIFSINLNYQLLFRNILKHEKTYKFGIDIYSRKYWKKCERNYFIFILLSIISIAVIKNRSN